MGHGEAILAIFMPRRASLCQPPTSGVVHNACPRSLTQAPNRAAYCDYRLPHTASRSFTAPSRSTETSCETPRSAMVTP
jgi:hypothetical protein